MDFYKKHQVKVNGKYLIAFTDDCSITITIEANQAHSLHTSRDVVQLLSNPK